MDKGETSFSDMQTVKRNFFAMRNGVIADTLRRSGSPFRIIFGLNLPQISEIALKSPHSREMAESLWANKTTRESMLIAPMLVKQEDFTIDDARRWIADIPAEEVADVLCLKLLKHLGYAASLADELAGSSDRMARYTGLRLKFNLLNIDVRDALRYAEKALSSETDKRCITLAAQLKDECLWMLEEE
ncbi:MAG: hypothetical protein K2J12_03550 [Muribaculaceae bacterium]|nr:hypothetical protein [Muribaculaceae bacterium]